MIELHPPLSAGPLKIAATGEDIVAAMRQFGEPQVFGRVAGERPGWCVHGPGGLFVSAYFDANDRAIAIELGRPTDPAISVTYDGIDIFRTPAVDVVAMLRRTTTVLEKDDGCSFTAPDLLLALWRPFAPYEPDDEDGRYFQSVLVAEPGYYDEQ
jgi:hypothetical protein